jgi:hypothetical protein
MSNSFIDLRYDSGSSSEKEGNEDDSSYFTRCEYSDDSPSPIIWKKVYKDVFCPIKEENNKLIFKFSNHFLGDDKRALILDSKRIRTTLKLLMLKDLKKLTIIETDPKIYEKIIDKLKYVDNIEIYNDLIQNFIPTQEVLDYNIYYIDAMCSYPNIRETIVLIMSRTTRKRIVLALTSPLRNSGDSYEDVILFLKEKNRKIFSKSNFESTILHEIRYNGQNMCNKGMYFILYYLEKRKHYKKYNIVIDLTYN